jgi:hypothetical protein
LSQLILYPELLMTGVLSPKAVHGRHLSQIFPGSENAEQKIHKKYVS